MVLLLKRFKSLSFKSKIRLYLAVLFLPVCMLSWLNYQSSRNAIVERVILEGGRVISGIKETCIEPYLNDIEHCLAVMKTDTDTDRLSDPEYRNTLIDNWAYYKKFNKNISYIYIGTATGDIFTYPHWEAPDEYDPRDRPWYSVATGTSDGIGWTEPYRDYTADVMVLTGATPLMDNSGKITGVLAVDTRYKNLSNIISSIDIGPESLLFMTDKAGNVIAESPDGPPLMDLLTPDQRESILKLQDGVRYVDSTNRVIAHSTIEKTGWKVIAVISDTSIKNLLVPVKTNSIAAIYAALVFFILIALLMQNRLDAEYRELNRYIQTITSGRNDRGGYTPLKRGVRKQFQPILKQISTIKRQSITDSLTGLYNRRFIHEQIDCLILTGIPFSVLLFDIDNFKAVNDTFGHHTGDRVLKTLSAIIHDNIRPEDMAGRFGGEEFIVILNGLSTDKAVAIAHRIMEALQTTDFHLDGLPVTISGGVAESAGQTSESIIRRVDALLYTAKDAGKNRIEF